jgi:hypothetical protein
MISVELKEKAIRAATEKISEFFHSASHIVETKKIRGDIVSFYAIAQHCPIRQTTGGCGFNAALELFVVARVLEPLLVVESGVYRGFTTWVLRRAVPRAKLVCFDIDLSRLPRFEKEVE